MMRKRGYFSLITAVCFIVLFSVSWGACRDDNHSEAARNERTLFMFLPWSGNLYSFFEQNLTDMKTAIASHGLRNERVIVLLATSSTKAHLYEITCTDGVCAEESLVEYTESSFTTVEELKELFTEVKNIAPADTYMMTIGCHGMGWVPVTRGDVPMMASLDDDDELALPEQEYWEHEGSLLTRYFGGLTSATQINTTDLATALKELGIRMEYILFDDCYMASMEVAYDLREVTHYLIGSTCEMMAYGMPYAKVGAYLLGTPDYAKVCSEFLTFYNNYTAMPCGTLSVTDCTQAAAMAEVMKRINVANTFDSSKLSSLQTLDGYTPTRFFDFGDYVEALCTDASLLSEYRTQLSKLVPYKVNTPTYYTMSKDRQITLRAYSGLTISDPSESSVTSAKTTTGWYLATH